MSSYDDQPIERRASVGQEIRTRYDDDGYLPVGAKLLMPPPGMGFTACCSIPKHEGAEYETVMPIGDSCNGGMAYPSALRE